MCMSTYFQKSGTGRAKKIHPYRRAGPGRAWNSRARAGPNNISAAFGPGRAGLKVHGPGPGRIARKSTVRPV